MCKASVVFWQLGFAFIITHYRTVSVVLCCCLPKEAQTVKCNKSLREKRALYHFHESLRTLLCEVDFTLLLYIFETVTDFFHLKQVVL